MYAYVRNNPVFFIDPFGLESDSTKTLVQVDKGDPAYVFSLDEVSVKTQRLGWIKRTIRRLGRFLSKLDKGGRGESINGGLNLVTSGNAVDPTRTNSKNPQDLETINIDDLLPVLGGIGAGPYPGKSLLDFAEGLNKVKDLVGETSSKSIRISDRKIIKDYAGNGERTAGNGESIKKLDNKYQQKNIDTIIAPHDNFLYKTGPSYFDASYANKDDTLIKYIDSTYYISIKKIRK